MHGSFVSLVLCNLLFSSASSFKFCAPWIGLLPNGRARPKPQRLDARPQQSLPQKPVFCKPQQPVWRPKPQHTEEPGSERCNAARAIEKSPKARGQHHPHSAIVQVISFLFFLFAQGSIDRNSHHMLTDRTGSAFMVGQLVEHSQQASYPLDRRNHLKMARLRALQIWHIPPLYQHGLEYMRNDPKTEEVSCTPRNMVPLFAHKANVEIWK
ncbi:hypothetical protein B0H11DRAFT_1904123 [Mycena galericulata]|nr:hypothetical protein B0H11DRAFT_1904123 [Mycena galericulata]